MHASVHVKRAPAHYRLMVEQVKEVGKNNVCKKHCAHYNTIYLDPQILLK